MPQDKTPQSPASKGKDRNQSTPSKPDTRRMYAPPAPEEPLPGDYDESPATDEGGYGSSPPAETGYETPSSDDTGGGYGTPTEDDAGGYGTPTTEDTGGGYGTSAPEDAGGYGTTTEEPGYGGPGGEEVPTDEGSYTGGAGGGGGSDDGGGGSYGGGGSEGPEEETGEDDLREQVAKAQRALRDAEAELAKHQQHAKLLDSISAIVDEYKKQYPALDAQQTKLEDYRKKEKTCLVQILGRECADQVPKIVNAAKDANKRLEDQVAAQEADLAACRKALEQRKKVAEEDKATLDALMKPVASISARLKAVETFRAEVAAAHNGGEHAIAYWLLLDRDKLYGKLYGPPKVWPPETLKDKIDAAWKKSANSSHDVEKLEAEIKARELTLKADKAELAERIKTLDDRIRRKLSELECRPAEAA